MFSILDILKKHQEAKKKEEAKNIKSALLVKPGEEKDLQLGKIHEVITARQQQETTTEISISSILNKEAWEENIRRIDELYGELLFLVKKFYQLEAKSNPGLKIQAIELIEKAVSLLSLGTGEPLKLFLSDYAKSEDHFYYHIVNVCFLSIEIGLGLSYERWRLIELGTAAFLHDIGSVGYLDIINKAAKLSEEDYNKIKEHPKVGLNILNEFWKDPPAAVSEVISQEHERLDGSGYPCGIKGKDISEFAQIVALVDIYEAMIHQRPYRNKHTPSQTINTILTNKNAFGYKIIKVLIEKIGIFPVGFMVRLNNKEIGLVVKENPKSPLRPVVDIIFTPDNKKLEKPKQIDLARNPVICIEECLDLFKKEP